METPPPLPIAPNDKTLAILCHVAPFLGVPFLLPFIVYLIKREESAYVAAHARESLNFHLSILLYALCTFPFIVLTCGLFFYVALPLYAVLGVLSLVCAILAALRASEGGFYYYPLTLRMIP